jgi:hypothetical protein
VTYRCFNCGFKTGWSPGMTLGKKYIQLAESLGASKTQINTTRLELMKCADQLQNIVTDANILPQFTKKFTEVALPANAIAVENLPLDHAVRVYADSRGILGLYPLYHFPKGEHKSRLIIPFINEGKIVGYTGRHVLPLNKRTRKYFNMAPAPANFVFNADSYLNNTREIVVVTEGFMDAMLLDAVAVMSNEMSTPQAAYISKLAPRVILSPDRDRAGRHLIEQALDMGWEVSFPPWHNKCKDAADACMSYGRLATLASIIQHSTCNQTLIKVKSKIGEVHE